MLKTAEAVLEKDGSIRLLEKVDLARAKRVLMTILEDETVRENIREPCSARWHLKTGTVREEYEAWQHLQ